MKTIAATVLFGLLAGVSGRSLPSNVKDFYNKVKNEKKCDHKLAGGFQDQSNGPASMFALQALLVTSANGFEFEVYS
jgi:hypothetical protein